MACCPIVDIYVKKQDFASANVYLRILKSKIDYDTAVKIANKCSYYFDCSNTTNVQKCLLDTSGTTKLKKPFLKNLLNSF